MAEGIQIEVHNQATSAALVSLASQLQNRRIPNKALAIQMSSWIARNFEAEGALNQSWASLSPDYAKWKSKKFGEAKKILELSGHLRASYANFGYDDDTATVGTSLFYAAFHEQGVPEKNLPARPMLPTAEIALNDAVQVYRYYIDQSIRNAGLR